MLFVLWHVFGMPYSPQLSLMRYPFGVFFLNIHDMLEKKWICTIFTWFDLTFFFHSFPSLMKRDQHESTFLIIKNFSRQNYGYCYPISYIHFLNASSLKVTHLKMM